jgi:4-hydroxy-3-polyprenylbenzoate decarboxylase
MVIDATRKGPEDGHGRPWPDDIEMAPDVVESIRERARELGIEK